MNFTAQLPNGMTKAVWIASLKPGDTFCTRRPMKCSNCGENSLKHKEWNGELYCKPMDVLSKKKWQPLPPKLKVGCKDCGYDYETHMRYGNRLKIPIKQKLNPYVVEGEKLPSKVPMTYKTCEGFNPKKFSICSGMGTKAICANCGRPESKHCHEGFSVGVMIRPCTPYMKPWRNGKDPFTGEKLPLRPDPSQEGIPQYKPLSCELVSVMDEKEWLAELYKTTSRRAQVTRPEIFSIFQWEAAFFEAEAHREGFNTWAELDRWITDYYGGRPRMYRYEFRR